MPLYRSGDGLLLADAALVAGAIADESASRKLIGVVVNTFREVPALAHHPTKARNDSYVETGAWVQEAWTLAQEPREYMSAKKSIEVVDADGVTWTTDVSGVPSSWKKSRHSHRLDNDEPYFEIKVDGVVIGRARPWWGYFGVYDLSSESGSGAGISYDVTPSNTHFIAYTDEDGHVIVGHSGNGTFLAFDFHTSSFSGVTWLCLRWDEAGGRLVLWTEESGVVYERFSVTEGRTWTVATSIASGSKPCGLVGHNNTRYVYWIDGTSIKGQLFDQSDTALCSVFTAVASGVDDAGIACDERTIGAGQHQIVLWYVSAGVLTEVYSDNGQGFS